MLTRKPTHEVEGWCDDEACTECCYHTEHEHFVCMYCGKQLEPSDYYDEDYGEER